MAKLFPDSFPPPWADAWGDDRYGLWANLRVQDVVQRMRWVEPGSFTMGSPDGTQPGVAKESNRIDNEGPQHPVTFTEGLWLADTACTQALWLAVMGGKNPSRFTGKPDLPVERVSWDAIAATSGFCAALRTAGQLPAGVQAVLPTEAEWEYACRAGSTTPFSFGPDITTEQVNYNGDYPYRGGKKSLYRDQTVPVKALPANDWGLYQMHGNVWEWCADGIRTYTEEALINPSGAMGKEADSFAVRGGSWFNDALRARSAQRNQGRRGARSDDLGFRFALRSTAQPGGRRP